MSTPPTDLQQLEIGLRDLTKLIKAIQYYPPGHPALHSAVTEVCAHFHAILLGGSNLLFTIRKEGIFLDEKPIGAANQVLQKLAPFLFVRRVQNLVILADLNQQDLSIFARILAQEPVEIRRQGGVKELLLQNQVSTLWVNETDLDRILQEKSRIEEEKSQQGAEEEGEELGVIPLDDLRDLAKILEELRKARDDQRYRHLLQELIPAARSHMTAEGWLGLLEAMILLCQHATDRSLPMSRREFVVHAINQLADGAMIDFLTDRLFEREILDKHREAVIRVLLFLRGKTINRLMERLCREENANHRRVLLEVMIRQGSNALPVLADYLQDQRWFVVRNAAVIIGEIRAPQGAPYLEPLLNHEDIRVCREAIRALTRIGGRGAVQPLLRAAQDENEEVSRQALLSLGAIKDESAVSTLLQLVEKGDYFLKKNRLKKDAIRALGEIGSAQAVPLLSEILKHQRLFLRQGFNELRASAAQALGDIGRSESIPLLERATEDNSPEVARQAALALRHLRKGSTDATGNA